ncbi:JAB domain-containing protein, partial [Pelobium manganitolerans]|uniref:JAB domain-containing protein n=1 Tax=Pelobium manganitolerans TaxID=1842495 RepID=UPI003FA3B671
GIGEAKAITIIAALELGRRRKETEVPLPSSIGCAKDAFNILAPYFADLLHEEFWILLLNNSHKLITKVLISKGGVAGTIADPKIIFKTALEHNAVNIVLAHNHPSGNLKPSQEDVSLTKKMKSAANMLDMKVLDHIIIAGNKFFSFADEELL